MEKKKEVKKITKGYILVYGDPQAELFANKEDAIERAKELVEDGSVNAFEDFALYEIAKTFDLVAGSVELEEVGFDENVFN